MPKIPSFQGSDVQLSGQREASQTKVDLSFQTSESEKSYIKFLIVLKSHIGNGYNGKILCYQNLKNHIESNTEKKKQRR